MEQSADIVQASPAAATDSAATAAPTDEQQKQQEVASIQQQLTDDPMQYELHVQLLRLLRSLHETDAVRAARQHMADLFPLTADLWQQWLDDDQQRIDSHDDQLQLLGLHHRACYDYLVPPLWLQYVQYAEQLLYVPDEQQWGDEADDRPDGGVNRVRAVYNEAVRAMGAHRIDGEKLWRAYRKFEVRVLTRMLQLKQQREEQRDSMEDEDEDEEKDDEAADENDGEEEKREVAQVMKQMDRITALYRRSLALPLNGLEQAYSEYKQWVQQQGYEVEADITDIFKWAQAQREARTPYEKAIPHTDPSLSSPPTGILSVDELSAWYAYIQFEHQQSAKRRPARVAVLYERALACCFLHADMWSAYTLFLEETHSRRERKDEEKRVNEEEGEEQSEALADPLSIYQRAVRNVPHSGALWSGLIRTLESRGSRQDEMMAVYQRASGALAARGGDELAGICLGVIDYLRRQLRIQLQRDNRSRSRSPMRSSTTPSDAKASSSSSSSTTLALPFSRPPSKRTVIDTALETIPTYLPPGCPSLTLPQPSLVSRGPSQRADRLRVHRLLLPRAP